MNAKTLVNVAKDPKTLVPKLKTRVARMHFVPDEVALKLLYSARMGKRLNLDNPTTFNEKLQWLKLHDRNPLYTTLVDKYAVKQWVAERIGEEYVIPTYGVWKSFDEIDLDALPEQFVLKCTHDSGGLAICRDRAHFDEKAAKERIERSLRRNYYWSKREWPYKNVPPRVIAEQYLEPDPMTGDLFDYKVFTFGGRACCVQVDYERFTNHRRTLNEREWERLPFTTRYSTDPLREISRPDELDRLFGFAEELAREVGAPANLRVDFYCRDEGMKFGEMIFYHGTGLGEFIPDKWDGVLGSWVDLPWGGVFVAKEAAIWLKNTAFCNSTELTDYKFMSFDGEVRCVFTCTSRAKNDLRVDFFDLSWNHLPFERHYPNADVVPSRPKSLDSMIKAAETLSKNIPFVRVDFYDGPHRPLFGEMTFYPGAGFEEFAPEYWDEVFGSWITLNSMI